MFFLVKGAVLNHEYSRIYKGKPYFYGIVEGETEQEATDKALAWIQPTSKRKLRWQGQPVVVPSPPPNPDQMPDPNGPYAIVNGEKVYFKDWTKDMMPDRINPNWLG